MPYCGPTFGLSHMHVITEHVNKAEEDEDETKSEHSAKSTPRKKGKGLKRGAPGTDMTTADPQSPEQDGDGLFKSGTPVHKGIFRCPTDMQIDTPHGHTQSDVLDLITESISKIDLSNMNIHIVGSKISNIIEKLKKSKACHKIFSKPYKII